MSNGNTIPNLPMKYTIIIKMKNINENTTYYKLQIWTIHLHFCVFNSRFKSNMYISTKNFRNSTVTWKGFSQTTHRIKFEKKERKRTNSRGTNLQTSSFQHPPKNRQRKKVHILQRLYRADNFLEDIYIRRKIHARE